MVVGHRACWGHQNGGMKKVLRLSGILALAISVTSGRNLKPNGGHNLETEEGGVASVCIVPATPDKSAHTFHTARILRTSRASVIDHGRAQVTIQEPSAPLWLAELNQWRTMAGLRIVTESAHLSFGSQKHARYLVLQGPLDAAGFSAYDRAIGPMAHVENKQSQSYTRAGAEAAIGGPLAADIIQGADVAWEGRSESGDIDNLIVAPFHRLPLLAPWAEFGGYGSFGKYPRRAAALALRGPLKARRQEYPIEFPPPNAGIPINVLSGGEWPNPIAGCAGYQRPVGLPITLQGGRGLVLRSYLLRDQTSDLALDACGFDAVTYRNRDATQQRRGRELLKAYGAAVLVPRSPMLLGHQYRVDIDTSEGAFDWSFRLIRRSSVPPPRVHALVTGTAKGSSADGGTPNRYWPEKQAVAMHKMPT
jgi:hypothetical protein